MSKYAENQEVEVLVTDFGTPGFPQAWMSGTVDRTEPIGENGLTQVFVRYASTTGGNNPAWASPVIGKRGGNRNIRPV